MKKLASLQLSDSALLALLVAGAAASLTACSKEEEPKQSAWSCTTDAVPMGETVRCTSAALTYDGPPLDSTGSTGTTSGGTTDGTSDGAATDTTASAPGGSTTYECGPDSASEDCPPADVGSDGASGGANGGGSPSGNGNGGPSSSSVGSDGASGGADPGECSYVPELPYCGGVDVRGEASSSGGTDCTKGNCSAPGQTKDGTSDGASDGASSSSSSGEKGKGRRFRCAKDATGNKACTSIPTCAPGTHPAPCGACVSDAEGSGGDCVAPSDGGCWVTGGGFVVAPNLLTGAAADGHDNFGGNAKPMKDGTVKGHWNHVDHGTGNHAKGRPSYVFCRKVDEPGPGQPGGKKGFVMNQVYFGGPAEWRDAATGAWGEGYWFDVVAKDHGEPGSVPKAKNGFMPDTYHFTIRLISDPASNASGTVVYETAGELQGGNIQLHPPNNGHPATQSTLPAWVSLEP